VTGVQTCALPICF